MANFKIYQGGNAYNDVKLGGESFGVACEYDEIEWSINAAQGRFWVKLPITKMSPKTKRLYENDQLIISLIVENTRNLVSRYPGIWAATDLPHDGRYVGRHYHPKWTKRNNNWYQLDHMSDQIETGVNIPFNFNVWNCRHLNDFLGWREDYAGEENPEGYVRYKVLLCDRNGRGYKSSRPITLYFHRNG